MFPEAYFRSVSAHIPSLETDSTHPKARIAAFLFKVRRPRANNCLVDGIRPGGADDAEVGKPRVEVESVWGSNWSARCPFPQNPSGMNNSRPHGVDKPVKVP